MRDNYDFSKGIKHPYVDALKLREQIIQADEERLCGENTISISEARKALKDKLTTSS